MCEPVSLTATQMFMASMAVTAASTAMSFVGQQQAANAQGKFQQRQFEAREQQNAQTRNLAQKDFLLKADAKNREISERREADGNEKFKAQIATMKGKATAETSAAENNALGGSLEALLGDFDRGEGFFRSNVDMNELFFEQQAEKEKEGFELQAENRSNLGSFIQAPVNQPSAASSFIEFTGATTNSFYKNSTNVTGRNGNQVRRLI